MRAGKSVRGGVYREKERKRERERSGGSLPASFPEGGLI